MKIVKQKIFGPINVQLIQDQNGNYEVVYSANSKRLECYEHEHYEAAEQDYNTVCDAIRNTLAVVRSSLE